MNPNRDFKNESLRLHKKLSGKIEIHNRGEIETLDDLSLLYTPGVGAVSSYLALHKNELRNYTIKKNSVAVISDGSAVLGLGNIGPAGAIPVLEGKCVIFRKFAGIDAFPIALDTQDTLKIIDAIKAIAPVFGGINLEDISAPRCFEIETRLIRELDIPVMHDDQHGTAIVVFAALSNALAVVNKNIGKARIVISGAGPAGTATTHMLLKAGAKNIIVLDSRGIIFKDRRGLEPYKRKLGELTNLERRRGSAADALRGADVFIGVSRGGILSEDHVRLMARHPIVFALANPVPEIMPDLALRAGVRVVATGRSDFPNQINNALVFPGVFRGALDYKVRSITDDMKLKAAHAISKLIPRPTPNRIIPDIFDKRVVKAVAKAIGGK